MATTRAYSYLRFSTPEQMQGDSFRRQSTQALEYAQKRGLELDEELTFHDLGVSAYRGKNAEAGRLAEFLEAVKAGLVERGSYLLVENLDRISRQHARKALRVLESICDEGITVVTLADGCREYTQEALDSDPMALIMSILTFIRANEESATKSKRVKAAWVGKREKAKQGTPITANGPWWLTLSDSGQWKVDPERAKVVRWCVQQVLKGVPFSRIARTLTEQGVLPPRGGARWYTASLNRILSSPALVGTLTTSTVEWQGRTKKYRSLEPIPGHYPAILDEETYGRLMVILKPTRRTRGGIPSDGNLFRGLAVCARCGAPMRFIRRLSKPVGQAQPDPTVLVCAAGKDSLGICKWRSVHYGRLEAAFFAEVDRMLLEVPAGNDLLDRQVGREVSAKEATELARANAIEGYERTGSDGFLDRILELDADLRQIEERLEGLERKREASSGKRVAHRVRELKAVLKAEPLDRMALNASLRQVFSEVLVEPEKGCAEFRWMHGGTWGVWFPVAKRGRPQKG